MQGCPWVWMQQYRCLNDKFLFYCRYSVSVTVYTGSVCLLISRTRCSSSSAQSSLKSFSGVAESVRVCINTLIKRPFPCLFFHTNPSPCTFGGCQNDVVPFGTFVLDDSSLQSMSCVPSCSVKDASVHCVIGDPSFGLHTLISRWRAGFRLCKEEMSDSRELPRETE